MNIPDLINFLQLGRYGRFSEQTYYNHFENDQFDWFAFNDSIINEHLTSSRKAIAIDPSYIPTSGHKTPWIGCFGQALQESISADWKSWASELAGESTLLV